MEVEQQKKFQIDERIINNWEKEANIQFTPKALKKYMDQWIIEGVENDLGNWEKRKEDELIKVWNRFEGSEFNKNCPIIRVEHYFPEIEDP
jgi:hypothetical protein